MKKSIQLPFSAHFTFSGAKIRKKSIKQAFTQKKHKKFTNNFIYLAILLVFTTFFILFNLSNRVACQSYSQFFENLLVYITQHNR